MMYGGESINVYVSKRIYVEKTTNETKNSIGERAVSKHDGHETFE